MKQALQARLSALMGEAEAIYAKADPSAEDAARIKAIVSEAEGVRDQIADADKLASIKSWADQAAPMVALADPAAPAVKAADAPAPVEPAVKLWAVKRFGDVPAAAEQIARELYGSLSENGSYEHALYTKQAAFDRYVRSGVGEGSSIARALVLTPKQIVNAAAAGLTVKAIKANMSEGSDELGGFVVPEDFRDGLIERLPGMTVVRKRANVMTTSRDVVAMARVTGGNSRYPGNVRVSWVDEEPTATEAATNATFGQVRLSIFTSMGHTQLSKNLLEDAMMDVGAYLGRELSSAFAIDEDEQFLVGTGAGKPQGILNGTAANGAAHNGDVTTVNSGSAAALTGDGVKKLPFGIAKQYRSASAVFVSNKATLQAVALLKDGQGRYLVGDERLAGASIPDSVLGYGWDESEAMPDVAANTYPIIFGDFAGYTIADRVGMSIQRYDDSTTAKSNAVVFVARRRLGGQVLEGWRFAVQKVSA